ncbi:MAG: tRNA1(Val) (adenine(37)-N6)-methyltransferase [Alphaproteobacteria bacterium]
MPADTPADTPTTTDRLLDGRVVLRQPTRGFRAAIDAVFLAAAVGARPGETALELGAGTGAASLCLAHRVPDLAVTGIERDAELVHLANANAAANAVAGRVRFIAADVADADATGGGRWDHVFANPPYLARNHADLRRTGAVDATVEGTDGLAPWIAAIRRAIRPRGHVVLIHRADRLADLLAAMAPGFGAIAIFPLWPHEGTPARRILVGARAGVRGSLALLPGLVLHRADGAWTAAAEAVLRDGRTIDLAAR